MENTIVSEDANETLQTIGRRRSIRMFTDRKVSEEDITAILRAANQAPSAHNQQAWRFIVLEGAMKDALVSLVSERSGNFPGRPVCSCAWRPAA